MIGCPHRPVLAASPLRASCLPQIRARLQLRAYCARQGEADTAYAPSALPERSNAALPTNSGASAAMHASRRSARKALQPPAGLALRCARSAARIAPGRALGSTAACPGMRRGQPTLAGQDHDLPTRRRPTRTDRTGACFPLARRGRPSIIPAERAPTRVSNRAPKAPRVSLKDASSSSSFNRSKPCAALQSVPQRCGCLGELGGETEYGGAGGFDLG